MSALKVGLTLSKHVLYTLPYTIVYRRVNWLLKIKMINMKYILSTDALLYCARSTDAYKATLFDVELILHGGWISKWMSRIMCALHRIQRHPQTMQVSPLNRYRPKIIPYSNKFVMVDMFVVMLVLLRRRRVEGGVGRGNFIEFWKEWHQCCKLCWIPTVFCFCQAMHPVLITPRDCNPKNLDQV